MKARTPNDEPVVTASRADLMVVLDLLKDAPVNLSDDELAAIERLELAVQ